MDIGYESLKQTNEL